RIRSLGAVEVFPDSGRIAPREEVLRGVRGVDVLCCLLQDRIDAEVIDAAQNLRLIVSGAITPANIDMVRATARGIRVTGIPNLVAETTADMEWALLMSAARRVVESDRALRQGAFPGSQSVHFAGGEVYGKTLGTIGLGAIARGVARRAHGFGMKVLYTKPRRASAAEEEAMGVEYREFDELLRESDFVTLNATYNPETHHLISTHELQLMKPTAYLVNASRGPMVDEAALVQALRDGEIAGAALDVYEFEPRIGPQLLALENVVLTPHLGSASMDTRRAIANVMADNLEAFLSGRPLPNLLNPEVIG
ncbi:glycerate dehydrogenase, partial [mine drainage metagenome]